MRFKKEYLKRNAEAVLAETRKWEDGKRAERVEKFHRKQETVRKALIRYADAAGEISSEIEKAIDEDRLVTGEQIAEIWKRYEVEPSTRGYGADIPGKFQTLEEVEGDVTPSTMVTERQMEHLIAILNMVEDDYVSTYALQQAGYKGHIPLA